VFQGVVNACGQVGMWRVLWAWGLAVVLAGCGAKQLQLEGTPEEGGQVLGQMLKAWQEGTSLADFAKSRTPAITVVDEEWAAGYTLKSYEVGAATQFGGLWRIPVKAVLSHPDRGERERSLAYGVTLKPTISIIRADDTEF
jgi:hypothetical protein